MTETDHNGGGVAIYVKSEISAFYISNLCSDETESLWLELKLNYKKPVLLCAIYHPPNTLAQYMENLITHLEQGIINLGLSTIIIGDLNIDISIFNSLNDICTYLNLTHLITEPTRVTSTSSSVIDHIMTTCPDLHSRSDVVEITISYHYLIFTVLTSKPNSKSTKYIYCRSFDKASFLNELEQSLTEFSCNPPTDL